MSEAICVAALSARLMAESARRGGFDVVAFDLFGDLDTRRATRHWTCIGLPGALAIDAQSMARALVALRAVPGLVGWVAGSGFERCPELLASAGDSLPLLGNAAATVRAVREPATFFAGLAACGIPHPEIVFALPLAPAGWLSKDARGSGGAHIRVACTGDAEPPDASVSRYYQRVHAGVSMSVLFLADGRDARICGVSELIVEAHDERPYVFHGAVGPAPLPPRARAGVRDIVAALVSQWRLVGLNSVDFLLDGERIAVLEVNPRPSASMALYDDVAPRGLMRAHVEACRGAALASVTATARRDKRVRGQSIVFANATTTFSRRIVSWMVEQGFVHDIPMPGTVSERGAPLCSVSAWGSSIASARTQLAARAAQVLQTLSAAQHSREPETSV